MNKINLKKLREVGEKATNRCGKWDVCETTRNGKNCGVQVKDIHQVICSTQAGKKDERRYRENMGNAKFISVARNNWEEMIEALKEAKEIIEVLHDDLDYKKQPSEWLDRFEDE